MMETVTVLKHQQIKTAGRCRLPIRMPGTSAGPSAVRPAGGSAAPQVKLVENTADYAILEVICGCGQSLFIQCQYAAPASP
jgi:hypothetical protein